MSEFAIISLVLLGIVALDSTGDALRLRNKQLLHHSLEVVQIGGWIVLWSLFGFKIEYVAMYVLGRIWLFDPLFNLVAGNKLSYIGSSSIYDKLLKWFTGWIDEQGHLIWVIRAIALLWWVVWFLTNADGRL